jgi:GNAT superfamily N-acetyltransferase
LSDEEMQEFIAMVQAGGEVAGDALGHRIRNAELLVTARNSDFLIAVAARKEPEPSYRKAIQDKADVKLDPVEFPFELGYVFVQSAARGRGLATKLCEAALAARDSVGIFATTRVGNDPMAKTLRKIGFEACGHTYASGRGKYRLQLYVRRAHPRASR